MLFFSFYIFFCVKYFGLVFKMFENYMNIEYKCRYKVSLEV